MPGLILSPKTAVALARLLRGPRSVPVPPRHGGEQGRIPVLVRCTSTTPAGSGVGAECYPGIIVDPDSAELVADQPELGDMWITLVDGSTPAVDTIYHGLLSGEFDPDPEGDSDPRPRVFVAAAGSVSLTETRDITGDYTITADDTMEDTGYEVALDAGVYLLYAQITAREHASAEGKRIFMRVVTSAGAGVDGQSFQTATVVYSGAGVEHVGTASLWTRIELASSTTIKIQVRREAGTWTTSKVENSTTYGNSGLLALKIEGSGGGGSGSTIPDGAAHGDMLFWDEAAGEWQLVPAPTSDGVYNLTITRATGVTDDPVWASAP